MRDSVLLFRHRHAARGFTLVEMFIVGALIALFAGIAVINIQQQFDSNKRKVSIGEARQLGTALGFAKLDLGFYPKLTFLEMSANQMRYEAKQRAMPTEVSMFLRLDYTAIGTATQAPSHLANWRGPYFGASQSRSGLGQGRGGFVSMALPDIDDISSTPQSFRWPADVYGNPWVLYLVSIDLTTDQPYFINGNPPPPPSFARPSASVNADFLTAVVSYGPNRVPGGGLRVDPGGPSGAGALPLRLFEGDFRTTEYRLLDFDEYTPERAAAVSARFGGLGLPNNDENVPTGILDPGSDDIVYEF